MKSVTQVQGIARVSDGIAAVLPERRHELWTMDPKGDLDGCLFDVLKGTSEDAIKKEARKAYDGWIGMKDKQEGMVPADYPVGWIGNVYHKQNVVVFGPFRIPEYDQLDMERRYIVRRWKRLKAKVITLDEAEALEGLEMPTTQAMYREFFGNMGALTREDIGKVERQAREQQRLAKVAEENEKWEREKLERFPWLKGA